MGVFTFYYKTNTGSISHAFPEKKSTVAAHYLIAL